jgi:hypothetical protein
LHLFVFLWNIFHLLLFDLCPLFQERN